MKKSLLITILVLFVLGILGYYFLLPHKVENAILVKSNSKNTTVYLNGKKHTIKAKDLKYPAYSVINYKRTYFKAYDFKVVNPINNRVMLKDNKKFELESIGLVPVATKASYYRLTKTSIQPCSTSDLIVGKNNVKSYRDSSGNLSTFIISPIDYINTRIGISNTDYSSVYHDQIKLTSVSPLKLYSLTDKYSEEIPANTLINIDYNSKGMLVTINGTSKYHLSRLYLNGGNIKILSIKRGNPEYNPEYMGTLEFQISPKGIFIVNELSIEDYLKKVIPSQVDNSGGEEGLKAQAVASRTYAILYIFSSTNSNLGFYIDDSSKGQSYNSVNETSISNSAISSTKGLIMTYNKMPIDAKAFPVSCGTGVRYEDVWFSPDGKTQSKPYLRTVNYISSIEKLPETEETWLAFFKNLSYVTADSTSPYFRWNIKISENALSNELNKTILNLYNTNKALVNIEKNGKLVSTLPKLGDLRDIKVTKRSRGGNAISTNFIFANATIILIDDYSIGSAFNFTKEYTGTDTLLNRLDSTAIENPSSIPSKFFSIEKTGKYYTIYGGGYGHGVGMSEYGAIQLSKKNWNFKSILNIYYKNIEYTTLY